MLSLERAAKKRKRLRELPAAETVKNAEDHSHSVKAAKLLAQFVSRMNDYDPVRAVRGASGTDELTKLKTDAKHIRTYIEIVQKLLNDHRSGVQEDDVK